MQTTIPRPRSAALSLKRHLSVALALASIAACTYAPVAMEEGPVPSSPAHHVSAPAPTPAPEATPAATKLPENWQELAKELTLTDLVDLALANNTITRASWLAARSAAFNLGSERAAYFPTLELDADITRMKQSAVGGLFNFQQTTFGPSLTLNYLLFDFGGRAGSVAQARASLLAADWQHNAAIQNVVLEVEQGYYNYLDAKSQLDAAESAEKEAREGLHAAKRRHEVGVATVADVLQAQTAVSQAELNRQTIAGQIQTLRGALATSMGLPANISFEVGELPGSVPTEKVAVAVDDLIERSLKRRPDLLAARWQAEKAMAKVDTVKAQAMPKFSVTANGNRVYYRLDTGTPYSDNWSAQLSVAFPLFTGFANTFDLKKAKADAASSRTQVTTLEQQVILDVWTAQSNLETAAQRVKTTADLLASASESERVMLARYKEGVSTILDLLTAQATLASARSQEIQARTDWLLAIAELAHATGGLQPPGEDETPTGSAPPTRESP